MKKIIKSTILIISFIYLILTLITNIYYERSSRRNLEKIGVPQSQEYKQETMTIPSDTNIVENMELKYYAGRHAVAMANLQNVAVSIFIGIVISAIIFRKDNSKIRFVCWFVLGNVIFNVIWTLVTMSIYRFYGLGLEFLSEYLKNTGKTFFAYCVIYALLVLLQYFYLKMKIKEINKDIKSI